MAQRIVIYKGQSRPNPPMPWTGRGFVYQIAYFAKPSEIEEIVLKAQREAHQMNGNAIIDAEFKDTMKDGKLFMREFSGTVVSFLPPR